MDGSRCRNPSNLEAIFDSTFKTPYPAWAEKANPRTFHFFRRLLGLNTLFSCVIQRQTLTVTTSENIMAMSKINVS